jgi:molybdopterin adenylyltransferase
MLALQDLGERLVSLSEARLAELALPETLVHALREARRITRHEARRRQMQYIGRLMREVDPEPIEARLSAWADAPNAEKARLAAVERWRDRLMNEAGALEALCTERPGADRDALAALIARAGAGTRPWHRAARVSGAVSGAQCTAGATMNGTALAIGLVSVSDRASAGVYEDKGIPGLKDWFESALKSPWTLQSRLIPDEQPEIERTLIDLADVVGCHLVLTTGGTGPAPRDVTPEATLAVAHKVLPGFGEQMRQVSLKYVPTAILSRQVAVTRGRTLIINLPGQPKAIKDTLDGIFPAGPYCIDLIGGPYVETNEAVCKAFRPKSALRPPAT